MRVKIKTWKDMKKEFGDARDFIYTREPFTKDLDKQLSKDRIIDITSVTWDGKDFYGQWFVGRNWHRISSDMIEKIIEYDFPNLKSGDIVLTDIDVHRMVLGNVAISIVGDHKHKSITLRDLTYGKKENPKTEKILKVYKPSKNIYECQFSFVDIIEMSNFSTFLNNMYAMIYNSDMFRFKQDELVYVKDKNVLEDIIYHKRYYSKFDINNNKHVVYNDGTTSETYSFTECYDIGDVISVKEYNGR